MSNNEPIRLDELLRELEDLGNKQEQAHPGWTSAELAKLWGVPQSRVRDVLAEAKERGLLLVSRKRVEGIDGRMAPHPSYRIQGATTQGGDDHDE